MKYKYTKDKKTEFADEKRFFFGFCSAKYFEINFLGTGKIQLRNFLNLTRLSGKGLLSQTRVLEENICIIKNITQCVAYTLKYT